MFNMSSCLRVYSVFTPCLLRDYHDSIRTFFLEFFRGIVRFDGFCDDGAGGVAFLEVL